MNQQETLSWKFLHAQSCLYLHISYTYINIYTTYYIIYWHNTLYLKNIISSTLLLVLEEQGNNSTFDATLQCLTPLGSTCCNTICINEQFVHTTRTHLWSLGAKNYEVTNICWVSCECIFSFANLPASPRAGRTTSQNISKRCQEKSTVKGSKPPYLQGSGVVRVSTSVDTNGRIPIWKGKQHTCLARH